ncbi:MAG: DUF4294 domain-containing protein [Bacteroidales bacterium]
MKLVYTAYGMKSHILIPVILPFLFLGLQAQEQERIVVRAEVVNGDTIPIVPLKEINIYAFKIIKSKRQARRLSKLIRNVKKVYPFAKLAGIKLKEYENRLMQASTDKERRQIMKQAEAEIKEKYGNDLKKLNFSQGKILIKLIDRETGNTSYALVSELRGKFIAFFWQAFARVFGYDLKINYDPEGKDKDIETIVRMIENGQI